MTEPWRPPTATCSVCGRERPCHYASTPAPVCRSCRRGRLARREPCAGCDQTKRVVARTPRGPECSACRARRLKSTLDCGRCGRRGRRGRPSVTDPRVCERCAGEPVRQLCRGCGAEEMNYADGRCARCVLIERLQSLAEGGDPRAVERLAPYLAALRDGIKPWSVLSSMRLSAGYRTLVELTSGELELSHEGLDTVQRGQSTHYLRAALVRAGSCPRGEQTVKLDAFIHAQAARLADGEDRARLRAFAVWQVQHDLKRRERRGQTTRASERSSPARRSASPSS